MAKKKRGLAAFVSKKKDSGESSAKANPPPLTDFVEFIAPGFAGYAGTRFASRAIHTMVLKRWPKLARHASVISTFGAAGLAWLLVHRVKKISRYHTPVVVGAGIAALQTATQAYLPKYGWLVSDHNLHAGAEQQTEVLQIAPQSTSGTALPAPLFRATSWAPKPSAPQANAPAPSSDDLTELEDLDLGSLGGDIDGDGVSDADIDDLLKN